MNEVKHIHLGRQQFTVSLEAYRELREYLDDISKHSDADVAEEVELRMAELLTERGGSEEKVVLPKDVAFLKEQLGEPKDFSDESEEREPVQAAATTRRLFRDTDNAIVAGVASGLAVYFGIDAIFFRLLFIVLVFAGGSGVLIYLLLWLLVPEARTAADRLSMVGKAATVDNLKEAVKRADVAGTAHRTGSALARLLGAVGKIILLAVGILLAIGSGLALLWTVVVSAYVLLHGVRVAGAVVAPIGGHEVAALIAGVVSMMTVLAAMLLIGIAMIRRRWQLPAWGVAALVGIFFLSASIGGALAADVVPTIQHQVQALHHVQTVSVSSFTQATVTGDNVNIEYIPDTQSYVQYSYYGNLPVSRVHTAVANGKLTVATGSVAEGDCSSFCTDIRPGLEVDIHVPKLTSLTINGRTFDAGNYDPNAPVFFGGWHPHFLQPYTVQYAPPLPH